MKEFIELVAKLHNMACEQKEVLNIDYDPLKEKTTVNLSNLELLREFSKGKEKIEYKKGYNLYSYENENILYKYIELDSLGTNKTK